MVDITLWGASYSNVPSILLPKTGGGTASFVDVTDTTATANTILQGYGAHIADGSFVNGNVIVNRYYTGSSAPSASLGNNGDLYLKV